MRKDEEVYKLNKRGLTPQQIAEKMGISEENVRSRLLSLHDRGKDVRW